MLPVNEANGLCGAGIESAVNSEITAHEGSVSLTIEQFAITDVLTNQLPVANENEVLLFEQSLIFNSMNDATRLAERLNDQLANQEDLLNANFLQLQINEQASLGFSDQNEVNVDILNQVGVVNESVIESVFELSNEQDERSALLEENQESELGNAVTTDSSFNFENVAMWAFLTAYSVIKHDLRFIKTIKVVASASTANYRRKLDEAKRLDKAKDESNSYLGEKTEKVLNVLKPLKGALVGALKTSVSRVWKQQQPETVNDRALRIINGEGVAENVENVETVMRIRKYVLDNEDGRHDGQIDILLSYLK